MWHAELGVDYCFETAVRNVQILGENKTHPELYTGTVLPDLGTLEMGFFIDFHGAFSGKDPRRFSHHPRADTTSWLTWIGFYWFPQTKSGIWVLDPRSKPLHLVKL